jgi:hypothetical protein
VDFSGFRFDNQFDGDLFQPGAATGEPLDMASINQLTLAAGLNFHTQVAYSRTALNVGVGGFHLNQPASSFYGEEETRMPRRFSFYVEGTIQLSEPLDLAIHSLFQQQQDYRELLYGLLLRYYLVPEGPFLRSVGLGAYFRHGDALAPMLEVQQGPWRVAFSYDINLSAFQVATLSKFIFRKNFIDGMGLRKPAFERIAQMANQVRLFEVRRPPIAIPPSAVAQAMLDCLRESDCPAAIAAHTNAKPHRRSSRREDKPFDLVRQVNGAIVRGRTVFLPGEICRVRAGQKSAEVIVSRTTSRGLEDARLNIETGGLTPLRSVHAGWLRTGGSAIAQVHSTDEGPNQSGITRPCGGGATRRRQMARDRIRPPWRRA